MKHGNINRTTKQFKCIQVFQEEVFSCNHEHNDGVICKEIYKA